MTCTDQPLIGRTKDQAVFASLLDQLSPDEPSLVEIVGHAGMGKSTLLQCFLERAKDQLTPEILHANGFYAEQDHAYGVLGELLSQAVVQTQAADRLDQATLRELATLVPSLRERADPYDLANWNDPVRICQASRRLLTQASQEADALVVAIDNAQWVDEASLAVIGYLTRHGIGNPLLVITAGRPRGADYQFSSTWGVTNTTEIELRPLTDSEAAQVIGTEQPVDHRWLITAAQGNPFYLHQLAKFGQKEESELVGQDSAITVPRAVVASVLTEVSELPQSAQQLVRVAAVMGDPFSLAEISNLADVSTTEAVAALDELLNWGIVVPTASGQRFRFRHSIIATALYESLGLATRLHIHGRAVALLRSQDADALTIARHLQVLAEPGDEEAINLLTQAAETTRTAQPGTAARLLASAVYLLPATGELAQRRPQLVDALCDCLILQGRFQEARQLLQETLREIDPANPLRPILLGHQLRAERWLGGRAGTAEQLTETLKDLAPGSMEQLYLQGVLLLEELDAKDLAAVRRLAKEMTATTRALNIPAVSFLVATNMAFAEAEIGTPARARPNIDWSIEVLNELPADQMPALIEGLIMLASAEQLLGDWQAALDRCNQGLNLVTVETNREARDLLLLVKTGALELGGDLVAATATLEQAELLVRTLANPSLIGTALARKSSLLLRQQGALAAQAAVKEAEIWWAVQSENRLRTNSALLESAVLIDCEQPERAKELLLRWGGGLELPWLATPLRSVGFTLLCRCELALGDPKRAKHFQQCAAEHAEGNGLVAETYCHRARHYVAAAQGEAEAAAHAAQKSLTAARSLDAQMEIVECLRLVAASYAALGEEQQACAALEEGVRLAHAGGADAMAAELSTHLAKFGVTYQPPREAAPAAAGLADLTNREQEIVGLIVQGLTNQQIADRLFIGRRTVESHLRRVFLKEGLTSRQELVALIAREQTQSPTSASDPDT